MTKHTNRNHVFVYGSLLSGLPNHRHLDGATFLSDASTRTSDWTMVDFSGAYPGVLAGGSDVVTGELYEVDNETLARLDRLEGHPTFYRRERVTVNVWDDDRAPSHVECWMYVLPRARYRDMPVVANADWREYVGGVLTTG